MSPAVFDAIDAYRKLLGTVSDCDIAREAGVSRVHVGLFRRMHGIPAYTGYLFASGHAPAGTPA
ncbi:MAG: hypothetical protein Q8S13_10760, partial [Dehalococcoidia bacterium]|nr:hypothetical protein [Dehalococcoidia bacterium]